MKSRMEVLEERLAAGDDLGMTFQEREDLVGRIRRAKNLRYDRYNDATLCVGVSRFDGTNDKNGTTPTLAALGYAHGKIAPEFRDGLEALGNHLEDALQASIDGYHSKARKHIRAAKAAHKTLKEALGA